MNAILVVASDAILRRLVSEILTLSDYQVTTVDNSHAATALLQTDSYRPDLILFDLPMQRSDGIELLEAVPSQEKRREIPVVVLASRTQMIALGLELTYEADGYISKPFTIKALLMTIQSVLTQCRLANQNLQSNTATPPRLA